MKRASASWLLFWVVVLAVVNVEIRASNVDTYQPVLRHVRGLGRDAYFGYSLVLHQTVANPTTMAEALDGVRIVVSAPKGTASDSPVPNTGLVFSCPVNPGSCSPLSGKLFDTTPNANNENKTDQFLGSSMHSSGDRFLVCAHRYTGIRANSERFLVGKCFYTRGTILEEFQEYQPCTAGDQSNCLAGTSSVIVPDGEGSYVFGVGAPGRDGRRGALIRRTSGGQTVFQRTDIGTSSNNYQGYAVASGRFLTTNRQDFAVSVPRRNMYFGAVNLVANDNNLRVTSQPLSGVQMGEYYGFSLLAADLNGDGYDELLVGAPLYRANATQPDTGRVYVYRNNMGNLRLLRTIEGRTRYSRFGYAMANLGDINGDGFDDVAISAPFTETGTSEPGTVFIYHSTRSQLLSNEPSQIIWGTDLALTRGLSSLRGFGTSLASGVDVDNNGYNDLLVGSFMSQQAFLLRTRPLARVQATISSQLQIVDVGDRTRPECEINGRQYACFTITTCATYNGMGLMNNYDFNFTLSGDTQNVERRIIFANNKATTSKTTTIHRNRAAQCTDFTAYVRNSIMDIFNPFIIEISIQPPPRIRSPGNGNENPDNLQSFPVVSLSGNTQVQVETAKQCGGGVCIPDLRIKHMRNRITATDRSSLSSIVAGLTSSVEIFLTVDNPGEDAFQAELSFILPAKVLEIVNVFNITANGEVSLRCDPPEILTSGDNEPLDMTRHNCSIGNPFSGPGSIQLRVELAPQNGIVGNEEDVSINFTVSSINPERLRHINDGSNSAITQMSVEARGSVTIDNGVVTPSQVSYSDNTKLTQGETLTNVSQLGAAVDVSFLVRNTGPSRVPTIELDILWPLNSSNTLGNYYLYISSIQSTGAASVTCSPQYINPLGLEGDLGGNVEGREDPTVSMGSGRRKRRSTVKRILRNKRQDVPSTEQDLSQNITVSCSPLGSCVRVRCSLLGLSGFSSTQIDINAHLDERFFSTNNDRYVFVPMAFVSIVSEFIETNSGSGQKTASAQIRVIPAARVISVGQSTPVPWWVIFVPIMAAVIVITIVAILLWVFGFFRRRKHEEIKQKREELQTLNDFGSSSGGTDF